MVVQDTHKHTVTYQHAFLLPSSINTTHFRHLDETLCFWTGFYFLVSVCCTLFDSACSLILPFFSGLLVVYGCSSEPSNYQIKSERLEADLLEKHSYIVVFPQLFVSNTFFKLLQSNSISTPQIMPNLNDLINPNTTF